MPHLRRLEEGNTLLAVVDMQEAFRSPIGDFALIASRISVAVRGFRALGQPILVTEQYPQGLGPTVEEISLVLEDETPTIEKYTFSACGSDEFVKMIKAAGARQIVICGIESHVCVNQTAHDLISMGLEVHLLADCTASRFEHDKQAGLAKMYASGVVPSSTEMAFFELMHDSQHPQFKEVQGLIR
ncbi:MAG TPA: hydrolase [Pyrinomonadaceae bacterium]|nr:hydrolase [Pyrinomonadaceae bacterium]